MQVPKPNGVHALLRQTHEDRVLRVLRERGALARGEIARRLGLSRTTVSAITSDLLARGAIIVADTDAAERSGSGRPAERLALDPRAGQYLGVDFGHRRVRVVVADASHDIVASGRAGYDDGAQWPTRLDAALTLINDVAREHGLHFGALQAIGIGVPGPVSTAGLELAESWGRMSSGVTVGDVFQDRFSAPVIIDNNMRFAALAEAMNLPGGGGDVVYARLADGVGGGVVVAGRLVTGAVGLAGELGHVRAVDGGLGCRCGKSGCLETVASAPAVLATCTARGVAVADLDELALQIERRHPVVDEVLREAGAALGRVLAASAMVLNPAHIIIGGEIARVAPALVTAARDTLHFERLPGSATAPEVRVAELGDDDGAIGAIAALFHQSPLLAGYPEPVASAAAPTDDRRSS